MRLWLKNSEEFLILMEVSQVSNPTKYVDYQIFKMVCFYSCEMERKLL